MVMNVDLMCFHFQPLTIDSSSEEGLEPDNFEYSIEFKNVNFSYPSRPDVQASHHYSYHCYIGSMYTAWCVVLILALPYSS